MPKPDFRVVNSGTVWTITPLTRRAKAWVEEHVQYEPWQQMGPGIVCDHRPARGLVGGIVDAGFIVR